MNTPTVYSPQEIKHWNCDTEVTSPGGMRGWIPARPMGYQALWLFHRLRLAWWVFTGRYDALDWSRYDDGTGREK